MMLMFPPKTEETKLKLNLLLKQNFTHVNELFWCEISLPMYELESLICVFSEDVQIPLSHDSF